MKIELRCKYCKKLLAIVEETAEIEIKCPRCKQYNIKDNKQQINIFDAK